MSGTISGGRKAAATNKAKHGSDYYAKIGHKGGSKCRPETRWFSLHPELAKKAGSIGGSKSKRGTAKRGHKVHSLNLTDEQIAQIKRELAEVE